MFMQDNKNIFMFFVKLQRELRVWNSRFFAVLKEKELFSAFPKR